METIVENFKNIQVYLIGEISCQVAELLKRHDVKISSYMSESVSVAITATEPTDENRDECAECQEIYDRPAVTENWVLHSMKCRQVLPHTPYLVPNTRIFSNKVFTINHVPKADAHKIWAMITFHGGTCVRCPARNVTHVITTNCAGSRLKNLPANIQLVTPDWITDSIREKSVQYEERYHPSLLKVPATPDGRESMLKRQLQAPPQPLTPPTDGSTAFTSVAHAPKQTFNPPPPAASVIQHPKHNTPPSYPANMTMSSIQHNPHMAPSHYMHPSMAHQQIGMSPMYRGQIPAAAHSIGMRPVPPGYQPSRQFQPGMMIHRASVISTPHEVSQSYMNSPNYTHPLQHVSPELSSPANAVTRPAAASRPPVALNPTSSSSMSGLNRMTEGLVVPYPSHASLPEETPIIKMTNMAAFPMGASPTDSMRRKSPVVSEAPPTKPQPPNKTQPLTSANQGSVKTPPTNQNTARQLQSNQITAQPSPVPATSEPKNKKPAHSSLPVTPSEAKDKTTKPVASGDVIYYGYDNNETVPRDLCLVGCIFYMGDYSKNNTHPISMWTKVIESKGGTVDPSYSNRVTHVLVETQVSDVCTLALNDNKRVITAHWLNDVVGCGKMDPPWRAQHLPHPHTQEPPICSNQVICTTGFSIEDNRIIREMVKRIGASFTTYLAQTNTVLICKRVIGEKVIQANEWNIPLVNTRWLSDIYLGNTRSLKLPINKKYQIFNPTQLDFTIDFTIINNIMAGWRVPLKIPKDCWRKFKPSSKTSDSNQENKRKAEDELSGNPSKRFRLQEIQNTRSNLQTGRQPSILLTGFNNAEKSKLQQLVISLGGEICTDKKSCTHLISERICRTPNFLRSINYCTFITSPEWITESHKCGHFVDERIFTLQNSEVGSMWNILEALERRNLQGKPFAGMEFYITPGVSQSTHLPLDLLHELIVCAGGSLLKLNAGEKRWSARNIINNLKNSAVGKRKQIVITCKDDIHLCYDLVIKNIYVYNVEFILSSIMNQQPAYETCKFTVVNSES